MINVFVTARIMYIVKTSKLVYIVFEGSNKKDQFTRATDYNELRGGHTSLQEVCKVLTVKHILIRTSCYHWPGNIF